MNNTTKIYYKVIHNTDDELELKLFEFEGIKQVTYIGDGTKFSPFQMENAKEYAKQYKGVVVEVREERTLIM